MVNTATGINPNVLKWAREISGFTLDEVAAKFKKDVKVIEEWESGESSPTYIQLETLAYKVYKRPIAVFFFPEPPKETSPEKSFRTLPDFEIRRISPDTRYRIREARAMQLALNELCDGVNSSENQIFKDIQISAQSNFNRIATKVRNYLDIQLDDQKSWKSIDKAFKFWRNAVQEKGIFVFKHSFKQKGVSGFCLLDDEFPIIYINSSTSLSRQIFTLFHELSHILQKTNGITLRDDRYINNLVGEDKALEIFCNRFSSEFLVPSDDFYKAWKKEGSLDDRSFKIFADRYKVSREVILRKLLSKDIITSGYYDKRATEWIKEYEKMSEKKKSNKSPKGIYYPTQASYLGDKFMSLAFKKYYQGKVTLEQLSGYLNIKTHNVTKLENYFLGKAIQ